MTSSRLVLDVRDLTVAYNGAPALDAVSFKAYAGERIAIIGPNGAGKSTLIKAIMGLLRSQSGTIAIAGGGRLPLGYVPQHEDVNWNLPVTARDVVMMGTIRQIGWLRQPGRAAWSTVDTALERVGMTAFANRPARELSGGQRRRVFIARALAQQAHILILDEPMSGVDASAQAELLDVIDHLADDGLTILFSTHDLDMAFRRFDKVMALKRRVIAFGAPAEVYTPTVLTQMYDRQPMLWTQPDGQVALMVDEHGCC